MSPRCTLNAALTLALTAGLLAGAPRPQAQVKIGATLSATGPQASLGIPERNTVSLLPAEIGGAKVEYVVLDDASDPTRAVSNSHKLISENKVDLIIGSSTTPNTMAMLDTVAAAPGHHAGVLGPPDRADGRQAALGVQDAAFRFADGRGHRAPCRRPGREETGVHRLQQRAGRDFLGGSREGGQARHRAGGQGELRAHGHLGRGADPQAGRGGAGRGGGGGVRHAGRDAGGAARARLPGKIYFNHGVANNDFLRVCGAACEAPGCRWGR